MARKLPVAEHLTDQEYKLLMRVYADHNSNMDFEKRKHYSLSHIIKVARYPEKNCLEVYYQNGNSWYYCADGSWFINTLCNQ